MDKAQRAHQVRTAWVRFASPIIHLTASKTDAIDAALLAEYAERMTPRRWTPPPQHCLGLRDIGRQINRLIHARTQAKNRLHALTAKTATPELLIEDEQEGIAQLDRRIERLKQAALELIAQSETLSSHLNHMSAAPGMGQASSVAVLAELCTLPSDLKAAQVSRHAGLDVRLTQSGTSVNRPGRLSKAYANPCPDTAGWAKRSVPVRSAQHGCASLHPACANPCPDTLASVGWGEQREPQQDAGAVCPVLGFASLTPTYVHFAPLVDGGTG
jgi:hypothetical protein